ncbi:MAG: hypothetical protein K5647_08540 [Clostridiales bacterium]|nr:hypothetical protein [Clostridiales bacterium]
MKKTNQITRKDSEKSRDTARKLLTLLVACVLSSAVYFWAASVETLWKPAIIGFLVSASVIFIVYFAVNRGMTELNITPDMISDTLTPDEKTALIEHAKERKKKTQWMLYIFIALITPVMIDLMRLFVFERIAQIFNG